MKSDEVKNAAKDLGGSAGKDAAEIKQGTKETASDLAGQAQGYKDQAADAAGDLYARAKDSVGQASAALPGSAGDAADQLARQVAKQPFEALLLAGAIGYLVGWATSRS